MAGAVYWIGQDGNIWYKDSGGTRNMGPAGSNAGNPAPDAGGFYDPWADASETAIRFDAQQIADPMVARETSYSGAGSGTPAKSVNTAAVGATQAAIDSLGTEQNTGYTNIDDSYLSVLGKYDRERVKAEGDYGEQTVTNTKNLTKNKQNALVAAAQGRRGLRGTLAALGALSGTGSELADRAVTQGANEDIGEAADAYAGNAQNLDKAIGNFRDEDKDRVSEAQTQRTNQRTALEGSVAAKRQQFYQKMAELFSEGGNTGEASTWLNRAGELNNEIASKTRVAATPFAERAAAFTPGDLEQYLAGAGDMTVSAETGAKSPVGTPSILAGRKRKKEEEAATV